MSESKRRESTPSVAWIAVTAIPLALGLFAIHVDSFDVWWHMATGRWIVENGAIPTVDPFSYTVTGAPWTYVPWLTNVIMYALFNALGGPGLVLMKVAVAASILMFLGLILRMQGHGKWILSSLLLILTIWIQPRYVIDRPLIVGGLLIAVGIYLASKTVDGRPKLAWSLAALMAVWIPSHGSAILGLAMGAIIVGHYAALGAWQWHRQKKRPPIPVHALGAFAVMGLLLLTPTGQGVWATATGHGLTTDMVETFAEWQPTDWTQFRIWLPWLLIAVGAPWWRKLPLEKLLVPLGFAALAFLLQTRAFALMYPAILFLVPLLGISIAALVEQLESMWSAERLRAVVLPLGLALSLGFLPGYLSEGIVKDFGLTVAPDRFPYATVERLRELPPGRLIHDWSFGGFFIWHEVEGGVFADGRTVVVYNDVHYWDFIEPAARSPQSLDEVALRFGAIYGFADQRSAMHRNFTASPHWEKVFDDGIGTFFMRIDEE